MAKHIFGLDISDHSIEAVVLQPSSQGTTEVVGYARTILKSGVVDKGVIKDPEALVAAMQELLASGKPEPITDTQCIVALPDAQTFTHVFKFPAGLRLNEIEKTIPFKAEEIIPFEAEEIYFDFKVLATTENTKEVLYVASPKEIVDQYTAVLAGAGLKPVAFDIEAQALIRSLFAGQQEAPIEEQQPIVIADIGARTTNLTLYDRGGIRDSAVVQIAGNKFTAVVQKAVGNTKRQADKLKNELGFTASNKRKKGFSQLQKQLEALGAEVKSFIEYYNTESGRMPAKVILAGGSSLLPDIAPALEKVVGIPVELGNALKSVKDPSTMIRFKAKGILFANVIGLALRGSKKKPAETDINLLHVEKRSRGGSGKRGLIITIVVIVLLLLGGLGFAAWRYPEMLTFGLNNNQVEENEAVVDDAALEAARQAALEAEQEPEPEPQPVPTVVTIDTVIVAEVPGGSVNVREESTVTSTKLGEADSGAEYDLLDQVDGWYQIQFSADQTGWISADYSELSSREETRMMIPDEAMMDSPEEPKTTESEIIEDTEVEIEPEVTTRPTGIIAETSLGYLNVRSGPGIGYEKVGEATVGAEYELFEEQDQWYRIELDDQVIGWVYSLYVETEATTSEINQGEQL